MLAQGKLLRNVLIMNMDRQLEDISESMYGKEISALNAEQIYIVVVCMVKGLVETFIKTNSEKKLYFISTSLEKGGFLENNLVNLGIYETLEGVLLSKGQTMSTLKKVEEDYVGESKSFEQTSKSFFEECKEYEIPAEAMGIRSIKEFEDGDWKNDNYDPEKSWLVKQEGSREIIFNDVKAKVLFYNMDVVGKDKEVYKFHLYDFEIQNEIKQDKQIYYDYFLVNTCVKQILQDMKKNKYDLRNMDNHAKIGMEGKYVSLIIPELIRIMVNEKAMPIEEAIEVVRKTCGYEYFSDMIEAVNKCPLEYVEILVPQLIEKIKKTEIKKGDEN